MATDPIEPTKVLSFLDMNLASSRRIARFRSPALLGALASSFALGLLACSGGNEADQVGVASICEEDEDCPLVDIAGESTQLQCITDFRGGYCSIQDCDSAADCPDGSTCVAHTDGERYCFRSCVEKAECNANRPVEDEANCSANFDYADAEDDDGMKACIPPSSD